MRVRRLSVLTLAVLALTVAPVLAGPHHDGSADRHQARHLSHGDGMERDWDGDTLVLTDTAGSDDRVAITPAGGLTINGDTVPLDRGERRLVQDFYGGYVRIEEEVVTLGAAGAKLGVAGAALAARALARVVRLSRDDYDEEDIEREMEAEAARMESKGADLEKRGEAIASLVDELRGTVTAMRAAIPELDALDWFRVDGDGEDEEGGVRRGPVR
jgi:hypothetical protein